MWVRSLKRNIKRSHLLTVDKGSLYTICIVMVMGSRNWIGKGLEKILKCSKRAGKYKLWKKIYFLDLVLDITQPTYRVLADIIESTNSYRFCE